MQITDLILVVGQNGNDLSCVAKYPIGFVVFLAVIDDVAHGFEPVFDSGLDELEVVV
jgi:hypothetical protein